MLNRLRTVAPQSVRGVLHTVSGPLVVALVAWGLTNEVQAAAIVAAILAVVDLLLAALHAETRLRSLIYPALAALAAIPIVYGVLNEHTVMAFLGVASAVLGGAAAARFTPHGYVGEHRRIG